MGATNYFKCAGEVFFFDERDRASTEAAFGRARALQDVLTEETKVKTPHPEPIVVWRRPKLSGQWDICLEVGESHSLAAELAEPPRQWS